MSRKDILQKLVRETHAKSISFSEKPYHSLDTKTIMGEVPFREILFLDYRDTEAGSNPREYNGLKKTNLHIIKSLLKDPSNVFRFLHSGLIVSITSPTLNKNTIKYEDCCLTNGNQTRFIIMILILLKLYVKGNSVSAIKEKEFVSFIKTNFQDSQRACYVLEYLKFTRVKEIANFLEREKKYLDYFMKMKINSFLECKIRLQINIIDSIVEDIEDGSLDEYAAGTLIAEANNNTQNVKVDDIFGNKYKQDLQSRIFKNFLKEAQGNTKIEYRYGEIVGKGDKVHILTLLRPIVATGILCRERDIYKYTNQRDPIYKLFEKLLNKNDADNTIDAISRMIYLLYSIRKQYVETCLLDLKRKFVRQYKERAIEGNLESSIISQEIESANNNEVKIEKIIRKTIGYNIEHIFPVVVFRIKDLFEATDSNKLSLTVPEDKRKEFFDSLVEAIYKGYVEMKLRGVQTSLSSAVRQTSFYNFGSEAYTTIKNLLKFRETDYLKKNRRLIS